MCDNWQICTLLGFLVSTIFVNSTFSFLTTDFVSFLCSIPIETTLYAWVIEKFFHVVFSTLWEEINMTISVSVWSGLTTLSHWFITFDWSLWFKQCNNASLLHSLSYLPPTTTAFFPYMVLPTVQTVHKAVGMILLSLLSCVQLISAVTHEY